MIDYDVRVEQNMLHNTVKVWVFRSTERDVTVVRSLGDGLFEDVVYQHGVKVDEPTFELPRGILEKLVAAASNILPPSAATQRHLDDTIGVRDRLLSLVEAGL